MRIGIDARLWNETGVGRYIRNLVINLQEIDKKNEYILFVRDENDDLIKSQTSNPRLQIVQANIPWHSVREQLSFGSIIGNQNLDLMHFPYFSLPISFRKPFVVTIHDLIVHQFATGKASTLPLPLYVLKRLGFKQVFNHALRRSAKVIVPLESVRSEIIHSFNIDKNKIVITKEGFDPMISSKDSPSARVKKEVEKGAYFLYVGNAYPHKNVGFLLSSFFEFRHKNPSYRLVLVGRDDFFYQELRGVVSSKDVSFLENVSDSDLGYLYSWAEAFVSPSLMEGFGLPALEAMASNCPVVLSDIPSFREVCSTAAIYFNPHRSSSLIRALEKVTSESKQERKKRVQDGFKRSDEFSWKKTAEDTVKVYESCISL